MFVFLGIGIYIINIIHCKIWHEQFENLLNLFSYIWQVTFARNFRAITRNAVNRETFTLCIRATSYSKRIYNEYQFIIFFNWLFGIENEKAKFVLSPAINNFQSENFNNFQREISIIFKGKISIIFKVKIPIIFKVNILSNVIEKLKEYEC